MVKVRGKQLLLIENKFFIFKRFVGKSVIISDDSIETNVF